LPLPDAVEPEPTDVVEPPERPPVLPLPPDVLP
jgi:hypothetical protein